MEITRSQKILCLIEGFIILIGIKYLLGAIGLGWANMSIETMQYNDKFTLVAAWILDFIIYLIGFALILRASHSGFWLGYVIDIGVLIGCSCLIIIYNDFTVIMSVCAIILGIIIDIYRIYSSSGLNDGLSYLWRKNLYK
ncbi:MAG: hypothetical protein DBY35_00590 [Bacteroidales bacterium]|nr:MAG: hypothetical protein DBY35_00590 [Bacteroidales bacterium]